jgi:NADH:ubiquinone oxidoreductase subunit 2 (subunit N)
MIENAIHKVLDSPLTYAFAFAIFLISIGVFIRLIGNPVVVIIQSCVSLVSQIVKEFTGERGRGGKANAIIVILTFVMSLVLLIKPTVASFIQPEDSASRFSGLVVFLGAIAVFIFSLRATLDAEKMKTQMKSRGR